MDWTQLLQGSTMQDQQGQIDQQLADVLLRRRQHQPGQYKTGPGAALGGLGDIITAYNSKNQEEALRSQRQGLSDQLAEGRKNYLQEFMRAQQPAQAPPEMIAAPGVNQASVDRDQQQKLQQLRTGGMLSGDPLIAQYLERAPKMAQEQQQLEQGAQLFPLQQAMERQKLQQAGPQAALGGQTPSTFELLTKRGEVPKYAVNPVSGKIYDTRTGQEMAGSGGAGGALTDKRLPGMQAALAKDLDPNNFRSGVLKGNQERSNAAERLLALAVDPLTGGPANLTPQQMSEVSTSLATLIGGGGSSEGSRHELTPYTKGRTMAQLMQWVTDKPEGAEQQAFVKQMIDTAKREQGVAQGQIRQAQGQRLGGHLSYFGMFPDAAKSQLQSFGFDPSEIDLKTGKYTPKPAKVGPAKVTGDADFDALPSGTEFVGPDGKRRKKP